MYICIIYYHIIYVQYQKRFWPWHIWNHLPRIQRYGGPDLPADLWLRSKRASRSRLPNPTSADDRKIDGWNMLKPWLPWLVPMENLQKKWIILWKWISMESPAWQIHFDGNIIRGKKLWFFWPSRYRDGFCLKAIWKVLSCQARWRKWKNVKNKFTAQNLPKHLLFHWACPARLPGWGWTVGAPAGTSR